jgi:preprotein translocase subunit Sss1
MILITAETFLFILAIGYIIYLRIKIRSLKK